MATTLHIVAPCTCGSSVCNWLRVTLLALRNFRRLLRVPGNFCTPGLKLKFLGLINLLLTYSMVQSPSWEGNWFAASQEIPRISRNPKVHYRTHKRPPTVSILGQPNPIYIPTYHLLEIHSNIIHPSTPRSPQWFFPSGFATKTLYTPLSSTIRATYPTHLIQWSCYILFSIHELIFHFFSETILPIVTPISFEVIRSFTFMSIPYILNNKCLLYNNICTNKWRKFILNYSDMFRC